MCLSQVWTESCAYRSPVLGAAWFAIHSLNSSPRVSLAALSDRSTVAPALTISTALSRSLIAARRALSSAPNSRTEHDFERWRSTPFWSRSRQRAL
jgi:hypothetical protein